MATDFDQTTFSLSPNHVVFTCGVFKNLEKIKRSESEIVQSGFMVSQYHVDSCHVGVQHTLFSTTKKFWIVNGNAAVKRYLSQCGQCSLEKAKPVRQLMADLPVERTTAGHKAFAVCGLDYCGHVNYVEGRSTKKARGLLFTCMSSRSVHVEVVTSSYLRTFCWPSVGLMTSGEKLRLFFRTKVLLFRRHPRHSQTY